MNELQIFSNPEFGQIRTIIKGNDFWFVAKDVAESMGYAWNGTRTIEHVPNQWRGVESVPTPSGVQQMAVLSEAGLNFFVGRSDKECALPFQMWLAGDVVPSIRKHGGYLTPDKIEEVLSDPDTIIKLATDLKLERQKRLEAEKTNNILMHVNKTYTTTEIAKELGFKSAIALNNDLSEKKIQFKSNDTWVLYSNHADKGYVDIKQEVLDSGRVIYHRRWTQIGREFLLKLYSAEKIA